MHKPVTTQSKPCTCGDKETIAASPSTPVKETASFCEFSKEVLSRRQVAQLLQVGLSTLDTRLDIPYIKLGKTKRYLRNDIQDYLIAHRHTEAEK